MKLEFYNCPQAQDIGSVVLPEVPEFLGYIPDFELMRAFTDLYKEYPNILLIGHGGSITSFYGFYNALKHQAKKQAYFLNTIDPDYIFELKQTLKPDNTLVMAVSKSGETITQIEALTQFLGYPTLIITGKSSPLRAIGEKLGLSAYQPGKTLLSNGQGGKGYIITHPSIGGRYTGFTEVALLPALVAGLDAAGLYEGAKKFYALYEKDNLAWKMASVLYQLEEDGYADVFMPFYSHSLYPISGLVVQLCHESFGKEGRGQTYFAHEAPESQHHTNQRFFGGRKNICGVFISSQAPLRSMLNNYPTAIHSIQLKGHALFDVNKISLEKAMESELLGTLEDARIHGIPAAHLSIAGYSAGEIGQFTALWQLYAVYASTLRGVDPFNQPQVENSKNISFTKRLASRGLGVL